MWVLLVVHGRRTKVFGELVGSGKTVPGAVDARQTAMIELAAAQSPAHEIIEITRPPWKEPEGCYAEQAVEDLRVDFDPLLSRTAVVLAVGMAHCRRGFEQHKEDHGAPTDNVEAIDGQNEPERREDEFPECSQADHGGLRPCVFLGESVAIGIRSGFVGSMLPPFEVRLVGVALCGRHRRGGFLLSFGRVRLFFRRPTNILDQYLA